MFDYICSEDSDIAVYGVTNIVKGFRKNGDCSVLDDKILTKFEENIKKNSKSIVNLN